MYTPEEVEKLVLIYKNEGQCWQVIQLKMPDRNCRSCFLDSMSLGCTREDLYRIAKRELKNNVPQELLFEALL